MAFKDYSDAIIAFVQQNEAWAEPIVFALAFGESLAFLSLILPSTVILVGIGGLFGMSGVDFWPVWLAASLGSVLGYAISYWVGYYFKEEIQSIWPFSRRPDLIPRGRAFMEKYGIYSVFLGHFFGPVRAVIPVIAGMYAMPQWQFQIANVASAVLWAFGVLAPTTFGMRWLTGG